MNLLEIFGSIGGALYLVGRIIVIIKSIVEIVRNYYKYERFYEDRSNDEQEKTIGFKTEEKKDDETPRKEYLEKIKFNVDEDYFNMYWGTDPVDDEFIEEECEDEEDKYPNLHVER